MRLNRLLLTLLLILGSQQAFSQSFCTRALTALDKGFRRVASLFSDTVDLKTSPKLDPEGLAGLNRFGLRDTLEAHYRRSEQNPPALRNTTRQVSCNGTSYPVRRVLGQGSQATVYLIQYAGELQAAKMLHGPDSSSQLYYQSYLHYKNLGVPSPQILDRDPATGAFIQQWIRGIPISDILDPNSQLQLTPQQTQILTQKWTEFRARFRDQIPNIPQNYILNLNDGQIYMIDPH